MSRFGLAVRREAGKQKDLGSNPLREFGCPFSSKVVVCGHCLVTLSLTINENIKRALIAVHLSHSGGDSVAIGM